jgi:hypothetical protein
MRIKINGEWTIVSTGNGFVEMTRTDVYHGDKYFMFRYHQIGLMSVYENVNGEIYGRYFSAGEAGLWLIKGHIFDTLEDAKKHMKYKLQEKYDEKSVRLYDQYRPWPVDFVLEHEEG